MVLARHLNQKRSQTEVTFSQVTRDGREELHVELFVLSDTTKTEARSKHAQVLGLESNRVCDGRFPLSSLSMEPEDGRCGSVCAVDLINDFIQDLHSRAIEALLRLVQPGSVHTRQAVRATVFVDLLDATLDVWNWLILKLLHQLL